MVTNRPGRGLATVVSALLVLVDAPRGMATSTEVANAIGLHPVVVRRLLGGLRQSGLVESRSGPEGGWAIAKDPATICIGDIYRALADEASSGGGSELNELLSAAEKAYVERLDRVTLAELSNGGGPPTDS